LADAALAITVEAAPKGMDEKRSKKRERRRRPDEPVNLFFPRVQLTAEKFVML
jgi:hypothetical protein